MYKLYLLLLFILTSLPLQAQNHSYSFGHIAPADGLTSGTVTSFLEDHQGFLWIGTSNGLCRYDGFELIDIIDDTNEQKLPAAWYIISLKEDASHRIWVKTYNKSFLISESNTLIEAVPELQKLNIYKDVQYQLHVDNQGNLWNICADSIFYLDYTSNKVTAFGTPHFQEVGSHLLSISEIGSQVYFVNGTSFYSLDKKEGKWAKLDIPAPLAEYERNLQAFSLLRSYADKKGGLWIFSLFNDAIAYQPSPDSPWQSISLESKNGKKQKIQNSIRSIQEDAEGNIWIATDHEGIFIYSREKGIIDNIQRIKHNVSSLAENNINCLFLDSHETMWAGHFKSGISYYHPKYSLIRRHATGIGEITSLLADEDGSYWIGTDGNGLLHESATGEIRCEELEGATITSLIKDPQGALWIGTYNNGLYRLNNHRLTHYSSQDGYLPHDNVTRMIIDPQSRIWICSTFGSFYRFDTKSLKYDIVRESKQDGEKDLQALSLCYNPAGRIHMGTVWGLWSNDAETLEGKRRFGLSENHSFVEQQFYALHFDAQRQYLWMAHRQGITVYDQPNDTIYEIVPGQDGHSHLVYGLLPDDQDNIWLNTNEGIYVVTPHVVDGQINFHTSSFSANEMQLSQLSFNSSAAAVTPQGNLLFGCSEGFCEIDPKQMLALTKQQVIPTFASVRYEGKSLSNEDLAQWHYHNYPLHMTFYTGNPLDATNIRYSYRIMGISDVWQNINGNGLDISNLPWGERIEVQLRASGPDGKWSDIQSLFIETDMPITRTPLMIALYIIITASLVGALWRIIWVYQRKRTLRRHRHQLHDQHVEMTRQKLLQMNALIKNMQQEHLKAQEFIEELKAQAAANPKPATETEEFEEDLQEIIPMQSYNSSDEDFIQRCIGICERNMDNSGFGVEELGIAIGMSRSQLYKRFMAITGRSPLDVLRSLRMKRAKQLIDNSQLNYSEVAQMVGFKTLKTFTENFKQEFGMTPTEYQKR